LLNGTTIESKITQGPVIKNLLAEKKAPREIASELFMRCFGRTATDAELARLEEHWRGKEQEPGVYQDIFWALLNAKEFMFNH
jgi:hypothetical protein